MNRPLVYFHHQYGIIANISEWLNLEARGLSVWLNQNHCVVQGMVILFPDEATRLLFQLTWC